MKFTSYWERFYQKKERKEITISYSAKSDVWPHPYPHIKRKKGDHKKYDTRK
jgi:hypothetical protein